MATEAGTNAPAEGEGQEEAPLSSEAIPLPAGAERSLKAVGIDPSDPRFRTAVLIGKAFAGPLPPPSILKEYEVVSPDLPDRIIGWTDNQMAHRMSLELMATKGAERRMDRGQILTACLSGLGLALSTIEEIFGNAAVSAVLAIVAIGGPTAAFILARLLDWGGQKSSNWQPNVAGATSSQPKHTTSDRASP